MLRNAIIVGLSATAFWGNIATAQWDPQQDFINGVTNSIEAENARKRLGLEPQRTQQSAHDIQIRQDLCNCTNKPSVATCVRFARMLGYCDENYDGTLKPGSEMR